MTQDIRTALLQYARQKYGDFRTTVTSPSYSRICSDIYNYLLSKYPQDFDKDTASNEARNFTTEVFVNGEKENRGQGVYGGPVRGNVNAGWNNTQGRIASVIQHWSKLGH